MSYSISGTDITMTRGDTLNATITLTLDGEEYTPADEDVIRFAAKSPKMYCDKSAYVDDDPLILKTVDNDTMTLTLDPSDTKELAFGTYVYDMEITFADGTVDTFITEGKLRIKPEVY